MGIFYSKQRIIQEVYFGESKGLKIVQDQLSVLRNKYVGQSKFFNKINTDQELLKFNRTIEDFFGFKAFSLIVEPELMYNAYTYPLSSKLDVGTGKKYLESSSSGFRFKKEAQYSCIVFIHSSLITDENFTDREVLAIILHELGHNFSGALTPMGTAFGGIMKVANALLLVYNTILAVLLPFGSNARNLAGSFNGLQDLTIKISNRIKKEHPELNDTFYSIKGFFKAINSGITELLIFFSAMITIVNPFGTIINFIENKIKNIIKNPSSIVITLFGYNEEKVSDEFATMYGYGADLSSALDKFGSLGGGSVVLGTLNDTPIIGHLYGLFRLPIQIVGTIFDPHPETSSRINAQLVMLEKELRKQDIDPKIKKQIQDDIYETRKILNRCTDMVPIEDPQFFQQIYAYTMYKLCDGDIRELFMKVNNTKAIDNSYNRANVNKESFLSNIKIK